MNLEDFKSFRRVLIPSEVGSIPTHSRQNCLAVVLLAIVVVFPSPAEAANGADEAQWAGPGPFERAVRSAVFPAWGQLTNGKNKKAAILFSFSSS